MTGIMTAEILERQLLEQARRHQRNKLVSRLKVDVTSPPHPTGWEGPLVASLKRQLLLMNVWWEQQIEEEEEDDWFQK